MSSMLQANRFYNILAILTAKVYRDKEVKCGLVWDLPARHLILSTDHCFHRWLEAEALKAWSLRKADWFSASQLLYNQMWIEQ